MIGITCCRKSYAWCSAQDKFGSKVLKYTRDQVWTSGLLEIRHTPLRLTHLPRLSVDTEAFDMWALGCVLYIMLADRHPFDPTGRATDEEIEEAIKKGSPPTRDSPY